jgi:hypothetical protein
VITDPNHEAQARWQNAAVHAQRAQGKLEDAARVLQQLNPVAEGAEYAARVQDARAIIETALAFADKAAAEYAASDAAWDPIEHCTLGL